MDIVFVRGLELETVIGVFDWERDIKQKVIIDLEMGTDIGKAAKTDALEDTLDYKAASKAVAAYVTESAHKLVETMAEGIATLLRREFDLPWVRVQVNKRGAITGAVDVGVIIERGTRR